MIILIFLLYFWFNADWNTRSIIVMSKSHGVLDQGKSLLYAGKAIRKKNKKIFVMEIKNKMKINNSEKKYIIPLVRLPA